MGRLDGKVAAITGAGSDIGRATARVFAREGARLIVSDARPDSLERLCADLSGEGHQQVVGDISLEQTAIEVAKIAQEKFGALDVLVGNVGQMFFKDITEVSPSKASPRSRGRAARGRRAIRPDRDRL